MAKAKDLSAELGALVAPTLQAGEEVVATVRVTYNGTVPPNALAVNSGLSAIDAEVPPLDPDAAISFPTANQMALALTGGRIFAWSLGLTGKPKSFAGEVPLAGIARVDLDATSGGSMVHVHMKSTAIVDLELMRGEDGAFVEELQSLVND